MRFDVGQHMRLQQQMKLSPRMIQSMEILQLAAMALEQRIEQELEENPVLELSSPEPETPETPETRASQPRPARRVSPPSSYKAE